MSFSVNFLHFLTALRYAVSFYFAFLPLFPVFLFCSLLLSFLSWFLLLTDTLPLSLQDFNMQEVLILGWTGGGNEGKGMTGGQMKREGRRGSKKIEKQ